MTDRAARPLARRLGSLALGGALILTSCTSGTTSSTPSKPACTPVPQVAFDVPTNEARTPLAIPADKETLAAAKLLKDLVFTHARDPKNPWAVSHALLSEGAELELTNGVKAVDWLFQEYAETFEVCDETLVRFPRKRGNIRIEPHTDLILKAITEVGITPDQAVTVQGTPQTVGTLYRGSLHRAWVGSSSGDDTDPGAILDTVPYGPPGDKPGHSTSHWNDTPWALQGLAAWAPDPLTWTAEGGHAMSMDRFTHAAVLRLDAETQALQVQMGQGQTFDKKKAAQAGGLVTMTCGGAHMIQGVGYALAQGFGEDGDRERYAKQIDLLFWRYQGELDTLTEQLELQPKYRTVLMMQRLKFLGHFLETTHKAAALGLFQPTPEQTVIMNEAAGQLVATVFVLHQTGIFPNLGKMIDPATPQLYPELGLPNEQLYLDYVGDAAHAYRGLSLALGHGVIRY